jgi:D-ornithine 4,5-aminomutase subunit beta
MHPAEGSMFEIKGILDMPLRVDELSLPHHEEPLSDADIEAWARPRSVHVVAATAGQDEHSVGLHEILDIKHGGIEKYGFYCHDLGTSVPLERLLDVVEETGARVALVSTIVTHGDAHKRNMQRLNELAQARGVRDELVLIAGGAQVTDALARACGLDAGFGRGTTGRDVASFIVRKLRAIDAG